MIRNFLLTLSIPIQKFMQKLHPPEPKTTFLDAEEVLSKMKPGDILLSRESWHFTNLFIPGFWSHAAIFGGENEVVEAVGTGVQRVHFYDWVLRKHNWCVLRPFSADPDDGQLAFDRAWEVLKKEYDYKFTSDTETFYCSELVVYSYNFLRWANVSAAITPQDLYDRKFEIIHEQRD